ncbi:ABC transporter permease subunit [Halorubrum sp. CBA1125]|uniref:ABC transporter permease n=1 Tax=Halorubrum sp. CBA1125 TaxID=2668072 RepID=UPI0012E8B017|nr:ABC transporter permease [Halorubrum sp. CBA1125]MUW16036.1 ABC transporter permease subunit [Halorubrum sp. CBA1125]
MSSRGSTASPDGPPRRRRCRHERPGPRGRRDADAAAHDTAAPDDTRPDGGHATVRIGDEGGSASIAGDEAADEATGGDGTASTDGTDTVPETDRASETVHETAEDDGLRAAVRHVLAVAATEYRLAVRGRWALALTGLFTVFGAMILTFGGSAVGPEGMARTVASLASLAAYLVPLAALAVGYDAIVGREAEGWLAVVFSLPVRRGEVVVGAYLGRLIVLAGATVLGFGFTGFLLLREFGTAHWGAFLAFLAGTVAVGAAFLAIAVLLSTVAREKTHALGLALLVWVWFVLVHDLLALGVVAAVSLPDAALSAMLAANPVSVFRVLVLSGLGTTAGGGFTAAIADAGLSQGLLAATLLAWCVVPVAAAAKLVDRRRL